MLFLNRYSRPRFAFSHLTFALIFAFSLLTFALKSQNLTGVWQGVIYQPSGGSAICYPTMIVLLQNGTAISGTRETVPSNSTTAFVKSNLSGSFSGGVLSLKDLAFTSFQNSGTFEWCLIEGDLSFDAAAESIKGTIKGKTQNGNICSDAEIELFRLKVISPLIFCEAGPQTLEVEGQKVKWYGDEMRTNLLGSGNVLTQNISGPTTFWVTQTTSHCNFESPVSPISVGLSDLVFSKMELKNPGCGPGLLGSIEVAAAGGAGSYSFQINTSAFQNSLIFNDLAAATYILTVKDGAGCTASKTATLVPPSGLQVIAIGSTTGCDGTKGTLTATVTGGLFPFDFEWSNGWPFQNQLDVAAGDFSITVSDAAGCSAVAWATVAAFSPFVLTPAEDSIFTTGAAVQININSSILLDEISKITWSPNEKLNCPDCLDPFAKPDSTTFYEITVIDTGGCEATTGVWVIVERPDPEFIFLPNLFSPNFDGLNDVWSPRFSENIELIEFAVFDRWGDLVFRSKNAADEWDGTWKGRNLDNGIYAFWIKYQANGLPEIKLREGDLMLVR